MKLLRAVALRFIFLVMPTSYLRHLLGLPPVQPDPPDDGPLPIVGERPRGSRRPHTDARVATVRRLIEQSRLTYAEISAKTGVGCASISRWSRDGGWQRPLFAPRATDTVPTARASQKLKLRLLAERLRLQAERCVRELEEAPNEIDKLMQALQVLKIARLEAQGRHRRRRWHGEPRSYADALSDDEAIRTALKELRRGGVDLAQAPQDALDLVIDAHRPAEVHPALRERGK
jgi:hypothetical protein